jgi:hypothetical protein
MQRVFSSSSLLVMSKGNVLRSTDVTCMSGYPGLVSQGAKEEGVSIAAVMQGGDHLH